jgi:hypothetical protein
VGRVEPAALGRAVARVMPGTQELVPLPGTMAGANRVPVNGLPWWLASPVHALAWRLPMTAYAAMVIAVALAAPIGFLAALGWARPSRTQHGTEILLAMLLGVITLYALTTTVFGDGFSEAGRHFLTGSLAVYAAWIGVAFAIPSLVLRWIEAPKQRVLEMVGAVLAVSAIAFGVSYAIGWARTQPLVMGLIDEPVSRDIAPGVPIKVSGWALDPAGIETVVVQLGKVEHTVAPGQPTATLKLMLPSYPDADAAGFATVFTAEEVAQARSAETFTLLRVVARSRTGTTAEIDRRQLVIPQLVFSQ